MLRQLPGVGEGEIDAGDDDISIDIGPVFVHFASELQAVFSFLKSHAISDNGFQL